MEYRVITRAECFRMISWDCGDSRERPTLAELVAAAEKELPEIPLSRLTVVGSGLRHEIIELIPKTHST